MASEIEPAEVPPAQGVLPSYTEANEDYPRRMVPRSDAAVARLDPNVTLEEYMYWASVERELEEEENRQYVEERGPLTWVRSSRPASPRVSIMRTRRSSSSSSRERTTSCSSRVTRSRLGAKKE